MNELKYVILIPSGFNREGARAIVFNGLMTHAIAVKALIEEQKMTVHSAGFCSMKEGVSCWGESTSLGVKSEPYFDQTIIARTLLGRHPLVGYVKQSQDKEK